MSGANKSMSADQPGNMIFSMRMDGREISVRNKAWPGNRIFVYGKNMPVIKAGFAAFHHFLAIFHPLPTRRSVQSIGSPPYCLIHSELLNLRKKNKTRKKKYKRWVCCISAEVSVLLSNNAISLWNFLLLFPHWAVGQSGSETDPFLCDIKTSPNVVRSERNH